MCVIVSLSVVVIVGVVANVGVVVSVGVVVIVGVFLNVGVVVSVVVSVVMSCGADPCSTLGGGGGGYNSAFLPFFRDFEILGGYSGFAHFSSFNDF